MNSVFNFIVKPFDERNNNKIKIDESDFTTGS